MYEAFVNFLTLVGVYALFCYLYDNLRTPYQMLKRKYFPSEVQEQSLKQRFGEWAVITGATAGIGKAYAFELARLGLNIVLISRSEEKLRAVAKEIENEFHVKTKIVVANFNETGGIYEHIERELKNIPVGILINNVGQSTPAPGPLHSFTYDELQNVINSNITAMTQLSRHFLERMKREKVKGIIVNVSSGLEMIPLPYGAIYAATKSYVRSLTLALQYEASLYGITVQLLSPNFVLTQINSYSKFIMRGGLLIPKPQTYAQWAVQTLGHSDVTTGYFWHGIQTAVTKLLPERARTYCIAFGTKMMKLQNT